LNDKRQIAAALGDLRSIADIIHRCRVVEDTYLTAPGAKPELQAAVASIDKAILDIKSKTQATSLKTLSHA